ncbi:hypothetical protein GOODEAATRI_034420, partial [Goodea atripinnis]
IQLAENTELSPEEARPRQTLDREASQEKSLTSLTQRPSFPESEDKLSRVPEKVDMDQSGSEGEEQQQILTNQDINQSGASCQKDFEDVAKLMDKSSGGELNLLQITADDNRHVLFTPSQSEMNVIHLSPPQNRRVPDVQLPEFTFIAETSSLSAVLQSSNKNLPLQQKDLYDILEKKQEKEDNTAEDKKRDKDGEISQRRQGEVSGPQELQLLDSRREEEFEEDKMQEDGLKKEMQEEIQRNLGEDDSREEENQKEVSEQEAQEVLTQECESGKEDDSEEMQIEEFGEKDELEDQKIEGKLKENDTKERRLKRNS